MAKLTKDEIYKLYSNLTWGGNVPIKLDWVLYHHLGKRPKEEVKNEILQAIQKEKNVEKRNSLISFFGGLKYFLQAGGGEVVFKAVDEHDDQSTQIVRLNFGDEDKYFFLFTNGTVYCKAVVEWTAQERAMNNYNEKGQEVLCEECTNPEIIKKIINKENMTMNDIVGWTYGKSGHEYGKLVKRT